MKIPSAPLYQYLDENHYFAFKLKNDQIIRKTYDLGHQLIEKRIIERADFEKLPLAIPQTKSDKELFLWILELGFRPSLTPSGFSIPPSVTEPSSPLPLNLHLKCSKQKSEDVFFPVKTLSNKEPISACRQVFPYLLVSGSENGMVNLFDLTDNFKLFESYRVHKGKINEICPVDDRNFATASADGSIAIWSTDQTPIFIRSVVAHQGSVRCILMLKSGLFVSGSSDKTIKIWVLKNECILGETLQGHGDSVEILFEHSSGLLLSASRDLTIKIWDRTKGFQCIQTLKGHVAPILAIHEREDGSIASSSTDGTILTWDIKTGKVVNSIRGFTEYFPLMEKLSYGAIAVGEGDVIKFLYPKPEERDPSKPGESLRRFYQDLLSAHPEYVDLYEQLAMLLPEKKQKGMLYLKAALFFLNSHDDEHAKFFYSKAFQEYPEFPFAYVKSYGSLADPKTLYSMYSNMIESYQKKGSIEDLIPAYKTILSFHPNETSFDALLSCYQNLSKREKATALALEFISFLIEHHQLEKAKKVALNALELQKDDRIEETLGKIENLLKFHHELLEFTWDYKPDENSVQDLSPSHKSTAQSDSPKKIDSTASVSTIFANMQQDLLEHRVDNLHLHLKELVDRDPQLLTVSNAESRVLLPYFHLARLRENFEALQAQPLEEELAPERQSLSCTKIFELPEIVNTICKFDEEFFATGDTVGSLAFWAAGEEWRCLKSVQSHQGAINCISCSEEFLFSGSEDQTIQVRNIKGFNVSSTLVGHQGAIYDLTVLMGGNLASASADKSVRIWNREQNFECSAILEGHQEPIFYIRQLSNGILISASHTTIRFWSPFDDYKCTHVLTDFPGSLRSMEVLHNDILAIGYSNGTIALIETDQYTTVKSFPAHADAVFSLCQSEDRYLISGSADHCIKIWDLLDDFSLVQTLGNHTKPVRFVHPYKHGNVLSSSADKTLRLWSQ